MEGWRKNVVHYYICLSLTLILFAITETMADRSRSRSRSPDRGAPPTDQPPADQPASEAPPAADAAAPCKSEESSFPSLSIVGNCAVSNLDCFLDPIASAPDEEVKLYVGNLDYGKNLSELIFPFFLAAVSLVSHPALSLNSNR